MPQLRPYTAEKINRIFKNIYTKVSGLTILFLGMYPRENHKEVVKDMSTDVNSSIIYNNFKLEIYTCSTIP